MQLARNAIFHVLIVATPLLGAGLLVGLVVSILQATTQIQEQTLAFIPKIIAILLSLLLFGPLDVDDHGGLHERHVPTNDTLDWISHGCWAGSLVFVPCCSCSRG